MEFSTKILMCIVGVLANAGIWGDAYIDTILAHTYGYSNNRVIDSKQCARLCKFGEKPRKCTFEFNVEGVLLENRKEAISINGKNPGPPIEVCLNDIVVVEVANKLPGSEISVHWHGIDQRSSPFMDGVPMVTQCPITSNTRFTYAFRADEVGTHFYHAHSVSQQLLGLFGSFVVKQPRLLESSSSLYDHDNNEHVIIVSGEIDEDEESKPTNLLVYNHNELTDDTTRITVKSGSRYRMRIINAIPYECPVIFSVQKHNMTVISTDGRAVKPIKLESFTLYPGERFDFILNADRHPSTYGLYMFGQNRCGGLDRNLLITYDGSNSTEVDSIEDMKSFITSIDKLSGQFLNDSNTTPADVTVSSVADKSIYLKVNTRNVDVDDDDNDYRYLSDVLPVPPFYPAELSLDKESGTVQINDKNFLYPNSPLLTQPEDVIERNLCRIGDETRNNNIECTQIFDVEYKSTLELIIVNEDSNDLSSKTFHLHGNPMYVLYTYTSKEGPITVDDVKNMDYYGKIKRNLLNPPRKDTITVPARGFTIVRIVADNIGSWMFECRSCGGVYSLSTAVVLRVKAELPKKIVDVLPKCGNFKRPDTLLE